MRWIVVRVPAVTAIVLTVLVLPGVEASASLAAVPEAVPVRGGGSPPLAPLLADGGYLDTVAAGAQVWYRIPLRAGQRAAVTLAVGAAPDGRETEAVARLHDAAGRPLGAAETVAVDRRRGAELALRAHLGSSPDRGPDTQAVLLSVRIGPLGSEQSPAGVHDVLVAVDGAGRAAVPPPPPSPAGTVPAVPGPRTQPASSPAEPARSPVAMVPAALVGLAIGGAGGFELMRWRLRLPNRH